MTPISSGTRLRKEHNTFAAVITSYNYGQIMEGDELWEAPADGNEVKKGDKWLHVVSVDGVAVSPGWMAYIHKGLPICFNFKTIGEDPPPGGDPPPSDLKYPQKFTLIADDGKMVEYIFVKVVE